MGYIAGIGAANVDIRGRSERKLIMGDSNPGTLYTTLGGVCRNICENLARLGSNVKLVTVVGDDENGRSILRGCEAAGIDPDTWFDSIVFEGVHEYNPNPAPVERMIRDLEA